MSTGPKGAAPAKSAKSTTPAAPRLTADQKLRVEALEKEAALFTEQADLIRAAAAAKVALPDVPGIAAEDGDEPQSDDVADSLEWVTDDWQAPLVAFIDAQCGAGSGAAFFERYEVHNYNHASEILVHAYPAEFKELLDALLAFKIETQWIVESGGNESPVPQVLQKQLYPLGWHETRLKGHMVVESHIAKKSPKLKKDGTPEFKKGGFPKYETVDRVEPTLRQLVVDAHKIDHVKGRVAFDMEWNSKDQTFDRDLYAMRLFHESHLISAGVLLTRSADLGTLFKRLDPKFSSSSGKLSTKYGASTTWMGKLLYRLRSSRSGGCPVLALGIKKKCVDDWEQFAQKHGI